jgi:predicted metal-dependent phosphoesterase TrpH
MIDLHMHSTASDGTLSPRELVEEAKKVGLKVMALTDHDTVDGIKEAKEKAKELDIEFICGIEFSTEYNGCEVHILGYFLDENNEKLLELLDKLKKERVERTKKILKKLEKYKCYLSMEDLEKEVKGDLISRSHIANAMMAKGFVYSKAEAFKIYLRTGGLAAEPKKELNALEAVKFIKEIGGVSSLAHPKLTGLGGGSLERLIIELKEQGLDAMEVYYPEQSDKETEMYKKLCDKYGLLYTGGSDFHGMNRPETLLGVKGIGEEELKRLKNRINRV